MPGTVPILRLPDEAANANANAIPGSGSSVSRQPRRGSFAASLHANFINFSGTGNSDVVGSARRRLSNVSDAVTRKISRWRVATIPIELIVSQGTLICASYIKNRLKRSGIFHRKLGFKRIRSTKIMPNYDIISDVSLILIEIGVELEKSNPSLFIRVARQIGFGIFSTEQSVVEGLTEVARGMFNHGEMNWLKIVAFVAVAGGIAVDCARQGHYDYISVIQRAMIAILEEDIAPWVQLNGGWETVVSKYRPPPEKKKPLDSIPWIWISALICLISILWLIQYIVF